MNYQLNQPINRTNTRVITYWINQSINQPIDGEMDYRVNQSINRSISKFEKSKINQKIFTRKSEDQRSLRWAVPINAITGEACQGQTDWDTPGRPSARLSEWKTQKKEDGPRGQKTTVHNGDDCVSWHCVKMRSKNRRGRRKKIASGAGSRKNTHADGPTDGVLCLSLSSYREKNPHLTWFSNRYGDDMKKTNCETGVWDRRRLQLERENFTREK